MRQIYGIDLSMEKFDVNYIAASGIEKHIVVNNNFKGICKFLKKVQQGAVLVAEHTGVYGELLVFMANNFGVKICLSSGYAIKHSLGLQKGKTDKIDSKRIREYGERFFDKLTETTSRSIELVELQELYALRRLFVKKRKMLKCHNKSNKHKAISSLSGHRISQSIVKNLNEAINEVERQITQIINCNAELKENYDLIVSVQGVGKVTACDLIIKTNNFKQINNSRKAASYAGVCPFPNASGKMVGKSKVSAQSDKELKTLLHQCAKTAVKHNKEYNLYYLKKALEGKHHFCIMNNVANKLLRTIYAIIDSRVPWDQNYICHDPREKNIEKRA